MPRTALSGVYDGNSYAALERVSDHFAMSPSHRPRQRLWKIVAKRAVIATGSHERIIAFGGNDTPGVMQASAIRTYANRFAAAPGSRLSSPPPTMAGARPPIWPRPGSRSRRSSIRAPMSVRALAAAAEAGGARIFLNAEVVGVHGGKRVRAIEISTDGSNALAVACDTLAVSGGFNPALGLTSHLGARPQWSEEICGLCARPPAAGP